MVGYPPTSPRQLGPTTFSPATDVVPTYPPPTHTYCWHLVVITRPVQTCSLEDLPPAVLTSSGGHWNTYGWKAGGVHPIGMLSCLSSVSLLMYYRTLDRKFQQCNCWQWKLTWVEYLSMLQFSKAKKLCFDRQVHYTKDSTVSTKMPIYFYCNYADRWRLLNQYKQLNPSDVNDAFCHDSLFRSQALCNWSPNT